ncbi:unnamed protein product [Knipowitschia caucasica]
MDPSTYNNIVQYLSIGSYPEGSTKSQKYSIRRRAADFAVDDEVLYYCKGSSQSKRKVVTAKEEAQQIFREFHASAYGAHCGIVKTRDAISRRFYWPGMSKDIDKWVSQCVECQKSALTIKQETKPIPIEVSQPFELVGMDLIGKVVKTEAGNEYIAVMIDYFTKWSEAYPLPSKTAADVAQCILKFFYRFGAPKRILTDQGKEFVNELNKELCKMLNIERSLCAPYHPQTNGLVEKHNGTIQRALCKLVSERPETWDTYLDPVMFGIRTKKQSTTKFSPYFLLFGREARLPCEVPENILISCDVCGRWFHHVSSGCSDTSAAFICEAC